MELQRKRVKPLLYSTAFTVALAVLTPGAVLAEEITTPAQAEKAASPEQAAEIPLTEIEVSEKKRQELTIGQKPDAEGVHNYVVTRSSTGSKTDVESKDVPQTIVVVGQKVLAEQHADTVEKALTNIAGVNTGTGLWNPNANLNPSFYIRGFTANNYYYDGLYDTASGVAGWTGNMDRIEVLKGPSSLFFGQVQPGGIINYISKKPLTEESYSFGQEFGSWGSVSSDLDASVPLTRDKRWLSRTIMETDRLEQFQKDVTNKHFNGSIIVQGQPKDTTTYTFQATYNNYDIAGGWVGGLPIIGTILPPYGIVPYDANYYDPSMRYYFIERSLSARVDQKVNNTWTLTSALRYSSAHNDRSYIGDERWVNGDYTTGKIYSYYSWDIFDVTTYAWDTSGNAKFKALGFDHNLVLGYEWSRYYQTWPIAASATLTPVDAYNPVFDPRPVVSTSADAPLTRYRYGAYLSDTVTVSDKLKVSGGISHAKFTEENDSTGNSAQATTWRLGANYAVSPKVTWFAGYGTSFDYNAAKTIKVNGHTTGTAYFKPKTGYQYESGIKYDASDKASITFTGYNIHQTNVVANTGTSSNTEYQLVGEQAGKGIELDANYVVKPGWNVLLAYSHNDSRTVNDPQHPAWVGKQTTAVPQESIKLWSTYEIQDGAWKGFGFGGGLTYVSKRPFYADNSLWVPGYHVIDGVIYYKSKDWKYSLNLYNLQNKKYWVAQSGVEVYAGTPRSFTLRAERKL